jgi:hypothetical protein
VLHDVIRAITVCLILRQYEHNYCCGTTLNITWSALRKNISFYHSEFSRKSDLVLPSSISCWCLLSRIPVLYIFSSVLPPITCFRSQFSTQDVTNPVCFPSFLFYVQSTTTLHNTSFPTGSMQLIFPSLLQYISELPRYLWSAFRVSKYQHSTKVCSRCYIPLLTSWHWQFKISFNKV